MSMPNSPQDFGSFLVERAKSKGLSPKRLAEVSGIPPNHLKSLSEERFEELPSAPYVRGYLTTLGELLEFDPAPWWQYLKATNRIVSSGSLDELPRNRFAVQSMKTKFWVACGIIALVLYIGLRFTKIFGQPTIFIDEPTENIVSTANPILVVRGRVEDANELRVNAEPVIPAEDGSWTKTVPLAPGINTISVSAKKFLGRESAVIRQIVYEPAPPPNPTSTNLVD
jgi:hypothetical protein